MPLEFLSLHLTYHIKTRTLQDVVSILSNALMDSTLLNDAQNRYKQFSLSCLSARSYADEFCAAISSYLTPSQIIPTTSIVLRAMESLCSSFSAARSKAGDDGVDMHKAKKRRTSSDGSTGASFSETPASIHVVSPATQFVAVTYVARLVLLSLPLGTIPKETLIALVNMMSTLRHDVVIPTIEITVPGLFSPTVTHNDSYSRAKGVDDIVGAAMLRFIYSLQSSVLWRFDIHVVDAEAVGRQATKLLQERNIAPELRVELVCNFIFTLVSRLLVF